MKKIFILSLLALFGCKSKEVNPEPLVGVWQLVGGNETIEFIDKTKLLNLKLNKEPSQPPLIGEGLYFYDILDDKIEVINSNSSCTCSKKTVYFKIFENNTLEIGDFYKSNSINNTLKFRKK